MEQHLIQLKSCPLCGSKNFAHNREVKDYSTSKEVFSIDSCRDCGLLFTNPRPSEEHIGRYYESSNYISHTNQKSGAFGRLYQALRNSALKKKENWIGKHVKTGRLLDYGCGTGEFLNHCKNSGWDVKGVEIADGPRNLAIQNYGLDVVSPENLSAIKNEGFDVVSLWHVLEHVGKLNDLFKELTNKLKKGGVMVLALPNHESYDAQKYGDYWAAWDVPIHFYHFSKAQISIMAEQNGYAVLETINMPYDSYYVSLLSEEYKNGKKNWINAFWSGLVSNIKGANKNASSLTYILRKL